MTRQDAYQFMVGCDSILDEIGKYLVFSRAIEFQMNTRQVLDDLRQEAESVLDQLQSTGTDDDTLNRVLGLRCQLKALTRELDFYCFLKEGDMDSAWEALIDAQNALSGAIVAHPVFEEGLQERGETYQNYERLLFPRQLFFSTGLTVTQSRCSICDGDYLECEHIVGRVYGGSFCNREIQQADLKEVSIVEHPADKRCRVQVVEIDGVRRNYLTWREVKDG